MSRRVRRAAALAVAALLVAGCFGGGSDGDTSSDVLTVFGPYRDVDADRFEEVLAPFVERTGVEVRYTGTSDFVADLDFRLNDGNDPPDIAIVPQPGLIRRLVAEGDVVELPESVQEALRANYSDRTRVLGTVAGRQHAVPFRLNVKSLVWYRPDLFADRGWEVPRSLGELDELVARIVADPDVAPWCLALRAGVATGWPATDWVEDLVLRRSGPAVYRAWVDGSQAFESPEIAAAFDEFAALVLAPRRLAGGTARAIEASSDSVFAGLLGPSPSCAMAKQADFASAWLPDGTEIGPEGDVDAFVLPDATESDDTPPLVVGSDAVVAFNTEVDTMALMAYLAGPDAGATWVADGGFISPKSSISLDRYATEFGRRVASSALSSDELVLDASDSMPSAVGTTLYWSSITSWVGGQITYEALATALDEAFAAVVDP